MFETNKQDKDKEVQELGKWAGKIGYGLGFMAGATAFGLLFGVILGTFYILNHTKNASLKQLAEVVGKGAQQNQISLKDLEKLSTGKPISNQELIHTAIFIDGLEDKLGSLKDGKKVGDNYTFTKTVDSNGVIKYTVEDDRTDRVATSFDLDLDGQITVQSRNETEGMSKLNEFVILNADKVSVNVNENISLYSGEASQAATLEQEVKSVKTSVEALNRIDITRLATGSAQSQYIESQDELNQQLSELKMRAKTIADQIHTAEVANDREGQRHPENTLLGIKVSCLVDKLVGLDKQIGSLQTDLQGKPQTITESRETPGQHRSFSEDEYPDLPADLNELQVSKSPANGQPMTIVEAETDIYAASQGMEQ